MFVLISVSRYDRLRREPVGGQPVSERIVLRTENPAIEDTVLDTLGQCLPTQTFPSPDGSFNLCWLWPM